jgi:hypothetical protein
MHICLINICRDLPGFEPCRKGKIQMSRLQAVSCPGMGWGLLYLLEEANRNKAGKKH